MNDQHPDAGYAPYATGSFDTDPLFGTMPGDYESGHNGHSGHYDASQWTTNSTTGYGAYGVQAHEQPYPQQYDAGQYDAGQYDTTAQWDANAWNQSGQFTTDPFETAATSVPYDATGQWTTTGYGTSYDSGAFDATAWNSGAGTTDSPLATDAPDATAVYPQFAEPVGQQAEQASDTTAYADYPGFDAHQELDGGVASEQFPTTAGYDADMPSDAVTSEGQGSDYASAADSDRDSAYDTDHEQDYGYAEDSGHEPDPALVAEAATITAPAVALSSSPATARPVRRTGGSRGRRRTPTKRSALLTVAVPSACVMGVAGVAAASVSGLTGTDDKKDSGTAVTAADPSSVKPAVANNKLDTQLAALSADARDFGDRASRTQERIDLKARQEAERKKREAEAARREALRPKFALPVSQHGLSAYYGQAGVNWMSMHTGIDFPVSYGTPVMAATDGTVRTQWNSAYGNMAIVTAEDGTETWYCHLSSTKIRSGKVKAGETIAFSGNSGNSTGPHLHFEVRPGGGSAVDPLPWLRSHGLSPT
ncbi:M23 family metallopeptidase [Streptomyces sp. NPDC059169]|uniref:M23 family metallopeptidase n=1 Tax=unclassified Streptomyces TaxID=2593676 RepID=UPI0036B26A55